MLRLPSIYPGDKTKWPNGYGVITVPANDEGANILLYNETPLNIDLDFENGSTDVIHAWEANYWELDGSTNEIRWQIDADSINVVSPPINALYPKYYYPDEKIKNKAYPMALVRQLGGASQLSGASSLVNTGNPVGQVLINVNDPAGTTVTADNDGQITWLAKVGAALVQWLNVQSTDNPLVQLGALNHIVNVLGNLDVDGDTLFNGRLGVAVASDVMDAVATGVLYIKCRAAGAIHFQTPNGTDQAIIDNTGLSFPGNNGWKGSTGDKMARTNSINNGSGSGTYNHGLGASPDGCLPYVHQAGSATVGYDSETSTQVHITLGAVLTFNAFLYKRS
jgi:hypothetical protein